MKPLVLAVLIATATFARADDIKVLASNGVRASLDELVPRFERSSGHKVSVTFGLAAQIKRDIEAGAALDLPVITAPGLEDPAKQGKIDPASPPPPPRPSVGILGKNAPPTPHPSRPPGP